MSSRCKPTENFKCADNYFVIIIILLLLLPPSIKFAGTHLYTWVGWASVREKCLAQEHNTMSPARARIRTARSGVERTNQEATAPPASHFATRYSLNILFAFQDGCQCWWFCCTWGLWWWYSWIFLSLRWAVLIPKPRKQSGYNMTWIECWL